MAVQLVLGFVEKLVLNRKMALVTVSIVVAVIVVSALTTGLMLRMASNRMPGRLNQYNTRPPSNTWPMHNQRGGTAFPMHRGMMSRTLMHRGFSGPAPSMHDRRPPAMSGRANTTKLPTALKVTAEQAKTTASDAVKAFKVGEAKDTGNGWMVSIEYNDKVVMNVLLAKLNTATSADAVKAVQDSIGKGWKVGEPKQLGFNYNVPVIDANGNIVGRIMVDGRTGTITTGFSLMRR